VFIKNITSIISNGVPPTAPHPSVAKSTKRQKTGINSRHKGYTVQSQADSTFTAIRKSLINDGFVREKRPIQSNMTNQEKDDYKHKVD
jgi:hypothetical protein